MTTETIANMIEDMAEAISGQFNYYMWPENSAPSPPYILFYYPNRDDFTADDINYAVITRLNIELYTAEKDFDKESEIESILTQNGFVFTKDESFINDEKLYEVLYTMEVTLNV